MSDTYNTHQPPWATGVARGYLEVGAQLCTRDGRRIGNAVVLQVMSTCKGTSAQIWTDACNDLVLNEAELAELFHEPEWLRDPASSPGMTAFAAHRAVSYLITRIRTEPRVASLIGEGTQAFDLLAAAWCFKTGMPDADLRELAQISSASHQVETDGDEISEHLHLLPEEHPLRNTPLIEIGAQRRWKKGGEWKDVQKHWGIANSTYNNLAEHAWKRYDDWRATKPSPKAGEQGA
ncbi:hypothetical protein [Methyloversatilis sp.]|uniref:hypothetical protein n=1 Tax=Methyloversatilis sp. TaxID=2569862 RepID=UPI00273310FF|nr:hypothetical protein [Methyloversatilis sp.]MDP3579108.1 hypothetical protein [Methyloversatilis sp.]